MNKHILIGNLGKDPEVKTFDNGGKIVNGSLATSETYKNKAGEKVTETDWHNIVFSGALADVAEKYLKKGDKVMVSGRSKQRSWETTDGGKAYMTEIRVTDLEMLGGRATTASTEEHAAQPATGSPPADVSNDLPF